MATFSARMYNTARGLLTKYGQAVTAVKDNTSALDPTTGAVTESPTDTAYSGVGYPSQFKDTQIDGTSIKRSDIKLLLSSSVKPDTDDIITFGNVTYTALAVQNITAQGNNALYIVQCRVM